MTAPPARSRRLDRLDAAALVGLVLSRVGYTLRFFDFTRFPEEDAAMLLRYSQHLAPGPRSS
ncbi:MAG: hypothetical protein AAB290_02670 [Candidatus Eisenbacteria bacterium]